MSLLEIVFVSREEKVSTLLRGEKVLQVPSWEERGAKEEAG